MFQFLPMAFGAGAGLLTSEDPLQGAIQGAALGGFTGGLGGLGGATQAAGTGLQAGGAAMAGAPGMSAGAAGTGLLAGGGQGLSMAAGAGTQLSAAGTPAAGGLAGIFNKDNLQTAGNVADMAGKLGIFDNQQQVPTAQSAGIPARQADFSGLMRSQGQANNMAGAQRLMQQQMARKQGRL